jgi:hypothetical protein
MIDILPHTIALVCNAQPGAQTPICPGSIPQAAANNGQLNNILNIAFNILGGLALLMIVISGLRYVVSAGDSQKAKQAREGIIFALVGLAIAVTAKAIITFIGLGLTGGKL